jgi:hypothetical protein
MKYGLAPLAIFLVLVGAAAANDNPLGGRDGSFQYERISIEGTAWEGKFIPDINAVVYFEKGGGLRWSHGGVVFRTGSWKQMGNNIHFETMNHYAEFRGVVQGDRIFGKADNVTKMNWTWDLRRRPVPAFAQEVLPVNPGM